MKTRAHFPSIPVGVTPSITLAIVLLAEVFPNDSFNLLNQIQFDGISLVS